MGKQLARQQTKARFRHSVEPVARRGQAPDLTAPREADFVIVTGMSGAGKGSVLKVFEDLGYYCVDNLPLDLIPKLADLCRKSGEIGRAALGVDIREGEALKRFPALYRQFRNEAPS